jgi:hypothetical protein
VPARHAVRVLLIDDAERVLLARAVPVPWSAERDAVGSTWAELTTTIGVNSAHAFARCPRARPTSSSMRTDKAARPDDAWADRRARRR